MFKEKVDLLHQGKNYDEKERKNEKINLFVLDLPDRLHQHRGIGARVCLDHRLHARDGEWMVKRSMRFDVRPFLRWTGGKQRNIKKFARYLPEDLRKRIYIEPFVGSGAMLIHVQPDHGLVSDINPHLINAYQVIKTDLHAFLFRLERFAEDDCEVFFNKVRDEFNQFKATNKYDKTDDRYIEMDVDQAARFVYLNDRCFNGLNRENSSGDFNVSFAKDLKGLKEIVNTKNFTGISALLREKDISLLHSDYKSMTAFIDDKVSEFGKKCFFFIDPPYYPLKKNGFTGYNKNKWDASEFSLLQVFIRKINENGHEFMLCNHDVPKIREMFKEYTIESHVVSRCVSCDARHREPAKEVVIMNYNNSSLADYLTPGVSKGSNGVKQI